MTTPRARSAESVIRESIRARSGRRFVPDRQRPDDGQTCLSGHPAFGTLRPTFELERMPEGGGYPHGFIELAGELLGVTDHRQVVHLCSGSVRAPRSFDYRPESSCAVVADCRRLPVRSGSVEWVMVDPPYGPDYAEALWGLGEVYPMPIVLMRECERILRPGGTMAFLHHVMPKMTPGLERVATYGITTGEGYRIRALTIARRRQDLGALFSAAGEG